MENNISNSKYNDYRKKLLIKEDNNESVSNIDLGFYGLTTYFKEMDNESLFEKIMFYNNDRRLISHIPNNTKLCFMPEQEKVINIINQKNRLIISAPTSFGKTLIVKEYIYRFKPSNIVYIVPTNALAYELEKDFKSNSNFNMEYTIFDKNLSDEKEKNEKLLFIGTQEKFVELSDMFSDIDLFVIDEAYKLQDTTKEQRGYKLSETFLISIEKKSNRIILLTPNAELIGFDKYNFYEYQTSFNAVDKMFHKIEKADFNKKLYECSEFDKTILYCETPNDMVEISENAPTLKTVDNKFVQFLENEFHPDWSVVKLLKKGILTHHGLMPKYVQNRMIKSFVTDNNYNLLIGTNSISEGINTPTKNLFFDLKCDCSKKEKLLYKNTIGRAGRLGKYPIGHIYSTYDISYLDKEKIKIELAVSNKEHLDEIEENKNEIKINAFFKENSIEDENCIEKVKSLKIPLSKMRRIIEILRKDLKYPGIYNIPYMAYFVFKEDYPYYEVKKDIIYIRGTLQYSYTISDNKYGVLKTFDDKIKYFNSKYSEKNESQLSNSSIIEGYMKFVYSTLEYYILPVMNFGKIINEFNSSWDFGKNVVETIKSFFDNYYLHIYGENLDGYTDSQKKIIESLKEYGISIKDIGISQDMIMEIENNLNVRYSTFDVINVLTKLSKSDSKYKSIYLDILQKYIY